MNLGLTVATGAVRGGTSILFAALGETIAERAGVVNLGTEGNLLMGALGGYAVNALYDGTPLPMTGTLLVAALACAALSLVLRS